ncbi:MAG: ABC transporter ATP-binding protein [Phycisphaeraceae bacterium]
MAQVKLEQVWKIYEGDVEAVKGIDLAIHDAQFVVLVGPSGCGKSTTLRMIAGLEDITGGTISIDGRVVNDVAPKDRDIAMVFQNYALYPHMTVYKNMAFGLRLRRMPKKQIDARVREAAKILGIDQLLNRKPRALSGGQRQRVAVGRAIVRNPKVFLFDEPLSNLDAKLRVEMRAELKRLHQRLETTTIYVTHDQEEAMTLGDTVVVMSEGLIQQAASPLEVYHKPVNRFVAGFVGTPPMNFIDGQLVLRNGKTVFEGGGIELPLDDDKAELVGERLGRDIVLGLRPEGMTLRGEGAPVTVDAQVVEPLGSQMDIRGKTTDGLDIVARVDAEPLDAGETVKLHVDQRKLHLFEPGEYGENLTVSTATLTAGGA